METTTETTTETKGTLRKREWRVLPVTQRTCMRIVREYHYARNGSRTAVYRHGLFHRSNLLECLGVAQWIPPTRHAAQASWDGDWRLVLALSRLVLAPEVPANAASFLIGQSVRIIAADGRFRCLVTYADAWQGHTGAIYKASNWESVGETTPHSRWLDAETGRLVSQYAGGAYRPKATMEALGYVADGRHAALKFRLILPRRMQPRATAKGGDRRVTLPPRSSSERRAWQMRMI